jgi:hypothetical protein
MNPEPEHPIVSRIVDRAAELVADRILASLFERARESAPPRAAPRKRRENGGRAPRTFPCDVEGCAAKPFPTKNGRAIHKGRAHKTV